MIQLSILIVEDELPAQKRLISNLTSFGYSLFCCCKNSAQTVSALKSKPWDIAIVDIGLKNSTLNGIELVRYMNRYHTLPVIYVTGYSDKETLIDVAKTSFSEYIVKPFTPQQLHAAIELALLKHPDFTAIGEASLLHHVQEVWLKQGRSYQKLQIPDIIYVETKNKEIYLHCDDKKYAFPTSMKRFDQQTLSPYLIRIHKSYMVNLKKVIAFDLRDHQITVSIRNQEKLLPVGPDFRKEVFAQFSRLKTE